MIRNEHELMWMTFFGDPVNLEEGVDVVFLLKDLSFHHLRGFWNIGPCYMHPRIKWV